MLGLVFGRRVRIGSSRCALALAAVTATVGFAPAVAHSSPVAAPTPASQKAAAGADLQRLLNAFVVPSSAVPTASPPPSLAGPSQTIVSPHFLDRDRVWIVRGTPAATLAFVRAHRPSELGLRGHGDQTQGRTVVSTFDSYSLGARWEMPRLYTEGGVLVTADPLGNDRMGLRIDTQAIWLEPRNPQQTIPDTVTRVEILVQRGDTAREISRPFRSVTARRLARIVNALGVAPDGSSGCPADLSTRGQYRDLLTFIGPGPRHTVSVHTYGCQPPTTIRDGSRRVGPALVGGSLDRAVMARLGLPEGYGYPTL